MKTLLTTDGSKEATLALRTASRLLRRSNNEVQVLCVTPRFDAPEGGRKNRDANALRLAYEKRIEPETKTILENARRLLESEGVAADGFSIIGSPSEVITQLAAGFDITVVGAHGRYRSPNLGLGPVASRVVEHAQGAVLVARELTGEDNLRVLVAVDGSAASKFALSMMTACFAVDEAEITLMHVKETPWIHLGLDQNWLDDSREDFDQSNPEAQLEDELQREAEAVVEEMQARLDGYNYSVTTIIEEGNPATEILGEAERGDYDLIILGATEQSDMKHGMLGSVSARVAWQANCSVAVVKGYE